METIELRKIDYEMLTSQTEEDFLIYILQSWDDIYIDSYYEKNIYSIFFDDENIKKGKLEFVYKYFYSHFNIYILYDEKNDQLYYSQEFLPYTESVYVEEYKKMKKIIYNK